MSEIALLTAVERKLRTVLNDPKGDRVARSFEGQPFPHSGQWFVGIAENGFSNSNMNSTCLDELYSVKVVLTFKMAFAPKKSIEAVFSEQDHMRDLTRKIVVALHQQWDVINTANEILNPGETDTVNGFIECLRFANASAVQQRGADWVWADSDNPPTVYVRELNFVKARRVQTLESMT